MFPFSSSSKPSTVRPITSEVSPETLSLTALTCSLSKYAAVKLKSDDIAHLTPYSVFSKTSGSSLAELADKDLNCSPDLGMKLSL